MQNLYSSDKGNLYTNLLGIKHRTFNPKISTTQVKKKWYSYFTSSIFPSREAKSSVS